MPNAKEPELIFCPFCGKNEIIYSDWGHVVCSYCGASGPIWCAEGSRPGMTRKEQAAELWNRRAK